ncbi:MAG: TetR/AcrR family transcriptional regulator [Oscillospiraceae bacterium]|nr:TetR/AcrR family transcriptional regulator [Oscillospiraceae bacterium]MBP3672626.1 TetR/AcrR family transcriptional regulator [Oscillospiraceae bacterium]
MPKSYSDQERAYIRKRLKEEAAACMGKYGIRRTTVDELVKRVHIPKGTFYLFYSSKELLLFEVIQEQHELVNQKLFQELSDLSAAELSAEKITDVIFNFYKMTEQMPIFRLINSEEIELLVRKLPQEVVQAHLQEDTDTIGNLFTLIPAKKEVDVKVISAAFHAIYYATLHRKEICEEQYDQALRMLIHGVVTQIF